MTTLVSFFIVFLFALFLIFGLGSSFFVFALTVDSFMLYRLWIRSSPLLSADALRGQYMAPKWRLYFLVGILFSCSLLAFHGLLYFKLAPQSLESTLTSLFLGSVTALSPWFTCVYGLPLVKETSSVRWRPNSVFEVGVINAEEPERIRQEPEREQPKTCENASQALLEFDLD